LFGTNSDTGVAFQSAGIVSRAPIFKVFTRSDLSTAGFGVSQNTDVKHDFNLLQASQDIGLAGFEPTTS
jgi:hypothetical protein